MDARHASQPLADLELLELAAALSIEPPALVACREILEPSCAPLSLDASPYHLIEPDVRIETRTRIARSDTSPSERLRHLNPGNWGLETVTGPSLTCRASAPPCRMASNAGSSSSARWMKTERTLNPTDGPVSSSAPELSAHASLQSFARPDVGTSLPASNRHGLIDAAIMTG